MTVFRISTYVVKSEKCKAHTDWGKTLDSSLKQRPELFREVVGLKVFSQKCGDTRRYLAIWEFKNKADRQSWSRSFGK